MISCTWPSLVAAATALVTAVTALVRQLRHENGHPDEPAAPAGGGQ